MVQVPFRIPRTVLPTNLQYSVPRVMEMRIEPCERFGIFSDTAAAIFAAVKERRRFTFNTFDALALVKPVSTPSGLDVDVTGVVAISSAIVVDDAIVDDVVVLATVVTTEDDELLGGSVVATVVVAASVVVAARVVDAAIVVVAAKVVVAATVVVAAIVVVVASVVVVVVVVVGNALKNGTATAVLLLSWVLSPSWPKSFKPQHITSPAGVIAQA